MITWQPVFPCHSLPLNDGVFVMPVCFSTWESCELWPFSTDRGRYSYYPVISPSSDPLSLINQDDIYSSLVSEVSLVITPKWSACDDCSVVLVLWAQWSSTWAGCCCYHRVIPFFFFKFTLELWVSADARYWSTSSYSMLLKVRSVMCFQWGADCFDGCGNDQGRAVWQ